MSKPKHILVLRFSALGDIAMTVPVIKNVLFQNPDLEITYVSIPNVEPLFSNIERLHFYSVDIKQHNGFFALFNLAKILRNSISFDAVADIHDVIRSKIIRFFLFKKNTVVIRKGRKERRQLIRKNNKVLRPLKTMFERYADVFKKLGFKISIDIEQGISRPKYEKYLSPTWSHNNNYIGVAPFAKHMAKLYPLEKMKEVILLLLNEEKNRIFIFGSKEETQKFSDFFQNTNVINIGGNLSFCEEIDFISQLDLMITMDSANMHFASLVGTKVVSIWGGTHPFAGFYGWGQDWNNIIQTDLPCRPSSIFGNKKCPTHFDGGCMQEITPQMVFEKVMSLFIQKK